MLPKQYLKYYLFAICVTYYVIFIFMNNVLPTKSANQAAVSTPLSQHPPLLKLPTTPDCEFTRSLLLSQPKDPKTFLGLNRDIFCSVDEIRNIFKLVNKTTLTKSIKNSSSSLHSVKITEICFCTFLAKIS